MTPMNRHFIEQSLNLTSYDWDNDTNPDPAKVQDLFRWLEQHTKTFANMPPSPFNLIARDSMVTFKDDSKAFIRTNLINDYVVLIEPQQQTGPPSDNVQVSRTSLAAYTYFDLVLAVQHAHSTHPSD